MPPSPPKTPVNAADQYAHNLSCRRAERNERERQHRRLGNLRLVTVFVFLLLAWLAVDRETISSWWLLIPVLIFLALMVLHERVIRSSQRLDRAITFYDWGVSRLEDRWEGRGNEGTRFLDASHPYAADLDIFGPGSLFELVCTARTMLGEEALAEWLCAPAPPPVVRSRQQAVAELSPCLDLREELAVQGGEARTGLDSHALASWALAPRVVFPRLTRVAALVLGLVSVISVAMWLGSMLDGRLLGLCLLVQASFGFTLRSRVRRVIEQVDGIGRGFGLLAQVLACFERRDFQSPRLREVQAALKTAGLPPSAQVARLHRLIVLSDSRRNQFFAPLGALLLWGTHLSLAIENWRSQAGPAVGQWLGAVGEMEALCALGGYGYEHPTDPFPSIEDDGTTFEGEGLGHPLIPEVRCVANDVRLDASERVLLVSGSNMSGKSTLLRTVGVNAVLALAGGPVRATRLRLAPLQVGASIRTIDSLQEGSSRFYAEITKLRQLMDLADRERPLLFLLDELLHGTNSHDRRIGAEGIVRGFVERGSVGLVTTHDLALAKMTDDIGSVVHNVHFEDTMKDGKITFDYRVRPGVVTKSNALQLMRSVGLEV